MHVVVFECDDFLVACYVLTTGLKIPHLHDAVIYE